MVPNMDLVEGGREIEEKQPECTKPSTEKGDPETPSPGKLGSKMDGF